MGGWVGRGVGRQSIATRAATACSQRLEAVFSLGHSRAELRPAVAALLCPAEHLLSLLIRSLPQESVSSAAMSSAACRLWHVGSVATPRLKCSTWRVSSPLQSSARSCGATPIRTCFEDSGSSACASVLCRAARHTGSLQPKCGAAHTRSRPHWARRDARRFVIADRYEDLTHPERLKVSATPMLKFTALGACAELR